MAPEVTNFRPSFGDVDDLRAFCAVVDHGSLTAAGRLMDESKAAMSRRIARLERRTGLSLFVRHPRAVVATERGRAFRRQLEPALALLDQALASTRDPATLPALRVTAPPDLGAALVGPMLAAFLEDEPDVRLSLTLSERVLSFETHGLDVAFRIARKLRDSSLVAHRVAALDGRLYATTDYLLRSPRVRRLDDLRDHQLLLMPGQETKLSLTDARTNKKNRVVDVDPAVVADPATLTTMALAGLGIALLPSVIAGRHVALGRLSPVLPQVRLDESASIFMVHRRLPRATPSAARVESLRAFATRWLGGAMG